MSEFLVRLDDGVTEKKLSANKLHTEDHGFYTLWQDDFLLHYVNGRDTAWISREGEVDGINHTMWTAYMLDGSEFHVEGSLSRDINGDFLFYEVMQRAGKANAFILHSIIPQRNVEFLERNLV